MVIASENTGLTEIVTPFAKQLERREDGALLLELKRDAQTQIILEKCVAKKIKLTRFEPRPATLHEAFVALVGHDVTADMELDAGAEL
jgi:ABC-2 type transport system ATP-binding protein